MNNAPSNARSNVPTTDELARAAQILNAGKRVAILAGAGALHATDELIEVSDTLLMVGSSFPYSEFLPEEGKARGIQIDIDGRNLSMRYPMELNLVGDSRETLRALIPLLRPQQDRNWRATIEDNVRDWWRALRTRAMTSAQPINPQRVFWELSERLPDGAIITGDSGSSTNWYARDLRLRRGMMASLSGGLATMGSAVPYALAAKLAYPERPVIALVEEVERP